MVSFFMDVSSEMIHSVLPIFITASLGLSPLFLGIVEGLAEGVAQVIRVFSGTISDNIGRRKPLMLIGYGIGAFAKPLFAFAIGGWMILTARVLDRMGKGIRVPPRDAMIADITPSNQRGAAYGLRQSMDTAGAFLGPLLAMLIMYIWNDNLRLVFMVAFIPAILCVAALVFRVKEPALERQVVHRELSTSIEWHQITGLGPACWWVIAIGSVASLARFSEAFLILKNSHDGLSVTMAPLVLIVMNIVYSFSAYPFGRYSDRANHVRILHFGMLVLIIANLAMAVATDPVLDMVGVVLWGLHYGMTQGLLSSLIANSAPSNLRATAFGVFGLLSGVMTLLASAIAGVLWAAGGASFPFYASMCFSVVVILMLVFYPRIK